MRAIPRRLVLALPLFAAACGDTPQRRTSFAPLAYGYLTPLPLNVARLDIDNQAVGGGPADIARLAPVPPDQALTQMAQQRLLTQGSTGRAVFVIQDASILRTPSGLSGHLQVRLDVMTENGNPVAFAEAQVSRVFSGDTPDLRVAAYDLTRQMMDDMNVEFEYQLRRSLRDWLLPSGAAPAAVQTQDLPPGPARLTP